MHLLVQGQEGQGPWQGPRVRATAAPEVRLRVHPSQPGTQLAQPGLLATALPVPGALLGHRQHKQCPLR